MSGNSKKATMKTTKRRRFQVISMPAPGEARERGPRIAYTFDNPRKAVETARWGGLMNHRSGRRYRVRDRVEKKIVFEINSNRCSHDVLCGVLYDGWQNLAPRQLDEVLAGEWLHEDYYEGAPKGDHQGEDQPDAGVETPASTAA